MARDTSGPKNEPQYSTNGVPADAADLTELGAYAALVGNRKALTNSQRTGLGGADRWVGLEVYETDTGDVYTYTASGWVRTQRKDTGWLPIPMALNTGWTVQSPDSLEYRILNGVLYLSGRLNATTGAVNTVFATAFPAEARPSRDLVVLAGTTGGAGNSFTVSLNTAGVMVVFKGSASILNLPLTSLPPMAI